MKLKLYIIIGAVTLLLVSCGQQRQARQVVEQFVSENVVSPDQIKRKHYSDLDSTRLVTSQAIKSLRESAKPAAVYKPGIEYEEGAITPVLKFIKLTFSYNEAVYEQTFYLDAQLSRVVAFKSFERK